MTTKLATVMFVAGTFLAPAAAYAADTQSSPSGTSSRRHSTNVLLPVEIPPVIPIAGMTRTSPWRDAFGEIHMEILFHLRAAEG